MLMNTNELWQAVLGELELSLSKANFTTWFKNTFIVTMETDKVCIGVPNMFTKAWLEKKYNKDILQSLHNITNQRIKEIVYSVETRQSAPQPIPSFEEPAESVNEFVSSEVAQQPTAAFTPTPQMSASTPVGDIALNKKYTFTNFIVGKQNELAHAAAQAVAGQPGDAYNPLFVYGGVGLGKTHLLQGIGHEILRRNPASRVLYVTCERFTNDFINSVRNGKVREFKTRYRNVDLLLVDDIQFITGKEGTQEEFFHTFNQLYQNNKQIVISSDRPPKAIPALENRLVSRFECGMMTDVGSPDFETRVAILELKCKEKTQNFTQDILHHIATMVQSNVRELEGALNKVIAFHQFKNMNATLESVKPILSSFQPTHTKKTITPKQLIVAVAGYFDIGIDDILGKSREKRFAFPRQIVMYLMREEMKSSYPTIGSELGGRDHTTAMHAYDKIMNILEENETLQHDIELIKQRLYAL